MCTKAAAARFRVWARNMGEAARRSAGWQRVLEGAFQLPVVGIAEDMIHHRTGARSFDRHADVHADQFQRILIADIDAGHRRLTWRHATCQLRAGLWGASFGEEGGSADVAVVGPSKRTARNSGRTTIRITAAEQQRVTSATPAHHAGH